MDNFELVCGLEVHVELSTKSKIFCGCKTDFGGEPNTHVCPVCSGMPGTLPVFNKAVADYAIRAGLALNCDITRYNKFDRKNYFYPDLPKAYQISQLYLPICRNGSLEIEIDGIKKFIGIHEIHMEEDAGKLNHDPWDDVTLVDYNRCGVPLLEIVSEPDFRSSAEVIAYLERIREILMFLGVSDCKMQEGSMRADVNVSVHRPGKPFGTRTEMKNMNSLKAIRRAVDFEAKRQAELIEKGGVVVQETRRWDANKDASFAMRSKENAQDYRYFPDPDLLPLEISDEWIKEISDTQPELPSAKRARYVGTFVLPEYDAAELTTSREIAALFEKTVALSNHPKDIANLIMTTVMALMSEHSVLPEDLTLKPEKLAAIVDLVADGKINKNVAKDVLAEVFVHDVDPNEFVKSKGLIMVDDSELILNVVKKVIAENPQSIEDFKSGKDRAFGFLIGQCMKELKGKANPATVNKLMKENLV